MSIISSFRSSRIDRSARALWVALALICALSVFFVVEVADLVRSVTTMQTNDRARTQIRRILADLLDAETGQRGYLLTGDERYLEPYVRGRNKVHESLRLAQEIDPNDDRTQAELARLSLLAERKLEELERTVLAMKRGDTEAALRTVRQGYGRDVMEQSRVLIDGILERLRTGQAQRMDELSIRLWRAAILLVLIMAIAVGLAFYAWLTASASARVNRELAQRLDREATHDALTGLPNRRFFERWGKRLVAQAKREGSAFTLLMLDLDGFKKVNDSFGHEAGDEVLKEVAVRFQETLREGEFLARLGGDEFAVLIDGKPTKAELARLGRRLINSLAFKLSSRVPDNAIGASVGISFFPAHGDDIRALAQMADMALYQSKGNGRGIVSFAPDL